MRVATAVVLALSVFAAQGPPPPPPMPVPGQPRDVGRAPEPVGTAVIRGRVVTADTGNPVRRANVNLQPVIVAPPVPPAGTPPGTPMNRPTAIRPRTVTTDSQGLFEFTGLPAGGYRVTVTPSPYGAGYVGMAYGGKQPMGPGLNSAGAVIDVADGQRFDKATIALPRGAVITGRITDENGDPLARVQVYTLFFAPGSTRGQRMGMGAQSDDLGQFRLYGLSPGEYAIAAEARGPTFVPPNAPIETEEDKIGFMTTYYPGTPDEGAAQRVRTRAGTETPGVEIRMTTGRLFRVSGTVTDSQGRPSARTSGNLFRRNAAGNTSSFGFSTDDQGRFQMRNIPPGNYRLITRGRNAGNGDGGGPGEPVEMSNLPLAIQADMEGLLVMLSAGATISGQVVFESGPPRLPPGPQSWQMRVNAIPGDFDNVGMAMPQPALVTPDLTFTMKGLHTEVLLRSAGPGMFLKSVAVGGRDVTDTPYEFKNGDQVTLVLTERASSLEGVVTDAAGKPVSEAGVIMFADDKSFWRPNVSRTRRTLVDSTGKYRLTGLLPGRYYIVAVPRERLTMPPGVMDATYFEGLLKDATPFVVGEDEQRQVDLKVASAVGG